MSAYSHLSQKRTYTEFVFAIEEMSETSIRLWLAYVRPR